MTHNELLTVIENIADQASESLDRNPMVLRRLLANIRKTAETALRDDALDNIEPDDHYTMKDEVA